MKLSELKNKKILILGLGREGKDTLLFLKKLFPKKKIDIADKKFDKNYLKKLKDYDVIIKSPGIPFKILPRTVLSKITSQTEIFFDNCPGKIVGITGTKGKSTTASLIYKILKSGGVKAHLVGNIGKPVLNLLLSSVATERRGRREQSSLRPSSATPVEEDKSSSSPFAAARVKDVYVYELSSFQLTGLKKSPHIAVLLNIYHEHLDYYRNFKEYVDAKINITRWQNKVEEDKSSSSPFAAARVNDYLIYNSQNKLVNKIAVKSRAEKIPIKGEYYDLDRNAARAVGELFKIPKEKIEKTIKNFKPLPHRLELVGTFRGITFYNDALATIPEATIAAINIFKDKVETIMLGGYDRGIDFKNLAKAVLESKIKNIILFPTTGEKIWQEILRQTQDKKTLRHFFVDKAMRTSSSSSPSLRNSGARYMSEAVKLAYQYTKRGKICLLSCASSSFSIFRDYKEKGDLFKKYVRKLGRSKR